MPKDKIKIEMTADKQCKSSVRYITTDSQAPITNIYVNRTFADPMPEKLTITIS